MLEMCEIHWGAPRQASEYIEMLFQTLGTPAAENAVTKLPWYPKKPASHLRKSWDSHCHRLLGHQGIELLEGLLKWDPTERLAVADVAACHWRGRKDWPQAGHAYLAPESCPLAGRLLAASATGGVASELSLACLQGERHQWNVRAGVLAPEIIQYLQEDQVSQIV